MGNFYEENKEFVPDEEKELESKPKKKLDILSYIPSVFLSFALISLSALGSLVQFKFEIKDIVWSAFLISFALRVITIYMSRYVGSNLNYNRALYLDDIQNVKKDFLDAGKDLDKSAFEKYVHNYNVEKKKRTYVTKIRSKLIRINKKIKVLNNKNELYYSKRREKKINKLKQKVSFLEHISSKQYVEENIQHIRIKYAKVRSCYFLSPVEDSSEKECQYNVNFSKENTIEVIRTLPFTIALILLGTLIGYDTIMGTANAVSIIYDVATMAFSFIMGWFIIGKRIISRTINAYINRVIFISEYKKTLTVNAENKEETEMKD